MLVIDYGYEACVMKHGGSLINFEIRLLQTIYGLVWEQNSYRMWITRMKHEFDRLRGVCTVNLLKRRDWHWFGTESQLSK